MPQKIKSDQNSPVYTDKGCSYHDKCGTCPFAECKMDAPSQQIQRSQELRAKTLEMFDKGESVETIASVLRITDRTVSRYLSEEGRIGRRKVAR